MATSATTIIAAAVARARQAVQQHFEDRDAYDPANAAAYDPPDSIHRRELERLMDRDVLREARTGLYWIDRAALRREKERQARAAWMALVIIVVLLLSAVGIILLFAR